MWWLQMEVMSGCVVVEDYKLFDGWRLDCVMDEDGVVELWLKMIKCVVVRRCWLFVVVADDRANGG
jgi:hypothetical protein